MQSLWFGYYTGIAAGRRKSDSPDNVKAIDKRRAFFGAVLQKFSCHFEIHRVPWFKPHGVVENETWIFGGDYLVVELGLAAFSVGYRLKGTQTLPKIIRADTLPSQ
jgi:hypothetical protein